MKGIDPPDPINREMVGSLKVRRSGSHEADFYVAGIREGNRTILSQAITLIESSLAKHQEKAQEIVGECLRIQNSEFRIQNAGMENSEISEQKRPGKSFSIRIGITGVPGAGKSTFIDALGKHLTGMGHKVAVLAIDPSSTRSKGSILGDKTRMEELSQDPNAFIRPSPSAGSLGGVARKTRESITLCEAAGFDVIFVETVGVGQSETTVHGMVDFFLLLMIPGAGDELQGIKRGIIEMADLLVINKADGDNLKKVQQAKAEYSHALHLFPPSDSGWIPAVTTCSSLTKAGIPELWEQIEAFRTFTHQSGYFLKKRMEQNRTLFFETIEESLKSNFFARKEFVQKMKKMEAEIVSGTLNPYTAAQMILHSYFHPE